MNLPISERNKYVILAGLYIGSKDPNQKLFLQPFINEANKLSTLNGFTWFHNGKTIVSKVIPLCCIADSVARYQLLNFQSFAAYYGCTHSVTKSQNAHKKDKDLQFQFILLKREHWNVQKRICLKHLKKKKMKQMKTKDIIKE